MRVQIPLAYWLGVDAGVSASARGAWADEQNGSEIMHDEFLKDRLSQYTFFDSYYLGCAIIDALCKTSHSQSWSMSMKNALQKKIEQISFFCEKHHLWPPLGWYKSPWFMVFYFFMLGFLILILASSLLIFVIGNGTDSFSSSGTSMEVIAGLTVGMFGVLATFTVVFFAFRAEAMAINMASDEATEYIKKEFDHGEKIITDALKRILNPKAKNSEKNDKNKNLSIYTGIDPQWWQLFVWGTVTILTFIAFVWSVYSFGMVLPGGLAPRIELNPQTLILLIIGMLGLLVTFTVALFAVRVAQLCRVSGRIASHNKIKELVIWHGELYHELLQSYRKVRDDVLMCENTSSEQEFPHTESRYKLLRAKNLEFDPAEVKSFGDQISVNYSSSSLFAFSVALLAVLTVCFIGVDLHLKVGIVESLGGIVSLSAILFALLIFFTSIFFLGRVARSAVISAKEKAQEVSLLEFNQQKEKIKRRINSLEKIAFNGLKLKSSIRTVMSELPYMPNYAEQTYHGIAGPPPELLPEYSAELLEEKMVNILMHLRCLKAANMEQVNEDGQVNKQFSSLCEAINLRWEKQREELIKALCRKDSSLASKLKEARKGYDSVLMPAYQKAGQNHKTVEYWGKYLKKDNDYDVYEKILKAVVKHYDFDNHECIKACREPNPKEQDYDTRTQYLNARKCARLAIEQLAWRIKNRLLFDKGLKMLSEIWKEDAYNSAKSIDEKYSERKTSKKKSDSWLEIVSDLRRRLNELGILQHINPNDNLIKYFRYEYELDKDGWEPIVSSVFIDIVKNILQERQEICKSSEKPST